jgi:hypothetical protein
MHSDERLDRLGEEGRERWAAIGGREGAIELAAEGGEYELPAAVRPAQSTAATA